MSRVEQYYDKTVVAEWNRLEEHPIEFAITCKALEEYLPESARILDIGGGPGRYSLYLAERGHEVALLDLSRANVEFARQKAQEQGVELSGYVHGNALNLQGFEDNAFDVALLMGPLYHLIDEKNRVRAVTEARRVLKPGGIIVAAFISCYAPVVDMLKGYAEQITKYYNGVLKVLEDGINNPDGEYGGFTDAYFIHPCDIQPFMESCGFSTLKVLAVEGIAAPNEQAVNQLPPEAFDKWIELLYCLNADPVTWGATEHMLYIGRLDG